MFRGINYALGATFIWGLIYVIPQFITGFSSMEIALGRYFVYGIVSLALFFKARWQGFCKHSWSIWGKSLYFSLICTIGYYTFLVLALRYSSPSICALILGVSPITIALYGNWRQKEIAFSRLIVPSLLILVGLVMINLPHIEECFKLSGYMFGLICSLFALAAWTWYVVANSRLLKQHPELPSSDWCTLIGIGTLFWVCIFAIVLAFGFENQIHPEKYFIWNEDLIRLLIGSSILGIFCSWVAEFLWNRASLYLPVSLAGQLTICESVFAIFFVFIIDQSLPSLIEAAGMLLQLSAVLYGVQLFAKHDNQKSEDPALAA